MGPMTSSGPDHENTGNSGTPGASAPTAQDRSADHAGGSSSGRSRRRRRRQVHRRAAPPSARTLDRAVGATGDSSGDAGTAGAGTPDGTGAPATRSTRVPKTFHGEIPDADAAPFVSLTVATSGIHPTTSRLIAVAAVLHDAEGRPVTFTGNRPACSDGSTTGDDATASDGTVELTGVVQQVNPGEDPGPWHLHGYTEADLGQAPGFATVAPLLFSLLDGRTVLCHDTALTWGFIAQEYRRAQRAANRTGTRDGGRGRRRNQRRPRKITVPVPERIVDTLATARRQSVPVTDPRLRSIAAYYRDAEGLELSADTLPELGAVASEARADTGADELLLADARILMPLHLVQEDLSDAGRGIIQSAVPADLTADRFGLQRSTVRVDATTTPRPFGNPGVPASAEPGGPGPLVEGMEFVVSPDVATDPDVLIAAGLREGLVYSEKLNRTSSLVVCNANHELRGKAMHAHRKNIPLFTDREFLDALADVGAGSTTLEDPDPRPATPRIPAPQRGGHGRGRNRQGGRQGGHQGGSRQGGGRQGQRTPIRQPQTHAERSPEKPREEHPQQTRENREGTTGGNRNRSRNRNRRRSSGARQNTGQNRQGQQGQRSGQNAGQGSGHGSGQGQRKQGGGNAGQNRSGQNQSGQNRSGARRRRRSGNARRGNQSNQSNQS